MTFQNQPSNSKSWKSWRGLSAALFFAAMATVAPKGAEARLRSSTPKVSTVSSSVSKNPLTAGDIQSASVVLKSSANISNAIVDIRFYDSSNNMLVRNGYTVNFVAGTNVTLKYDYQSAASLSPGTYYLVVGVWSSDWSTTYLYQQRNAFSVVSAAATTTTTTTTTTTQPVAAAPSVSTVSSSLSKNPLTAGDVQSASVVLNSTADIPNAIVDIRFYDSSNNMLARNGYTINFVAGSNVSLKYDYQSASSLAAGTYQMVVAVWSSDWSTTYLWDQRETFSVVAGTSTTPTTTTTTTTTSPTTTTTIPVALQPGPGYIPVQDNGGNFLQMGAYWVNDGIWGAGNLVPGAYTGINGTTYEQANGVSSNLGPNGEIAWRMTWKWPTGTTEVKAYPSAIIGNKPGCQNSWITPCGANVILPDGSISQTYPSGPTPNSFFPMQLPIAPLYSSFNYVQNATPSGRGHLSYDIWLQNTPTQQHGWNAANEITHEIMIPLTYWGNYGAYKYRNPAWYSHDATIDGYLFHIYYVPKGTGPFAWNFIVFEPDNATAIKAGTLDLSKFINYLTSQGWAQGNEYLVSTELGIEPVDGTGDLTVYNYRVWK